MLIDFDTLLQNCKLNQWHISNLSCFMFAKTYSRLASTDGLLSLKLLKQFYRKHLSAPQEGNKFVCVCYLQFSPSAKVLKLTFSKWNNFNTNSVSSNFELLPLPLPTEHLSVIKKLGLLIYIV